MMSVTRHLLSLLKKSLVDQKNIRRLTSSASNILDSGLPDVSIPKVSIPELVLTKCEKYEHLTAIECGLTGRKYTYRNIIEKSKNFSRSLRKNLRLDDGDVIAVLLPNVPEYPIVVLGALRANLIVTTINPIYTNEEIFRQLKDSSTKAVITLVELWDKAIAQRQLLKKNLPVITIKTKISESLPEGAIDFRELTDSELSYPDPEPRKPEEVAILPYSSGTTGFPKGVEITNYNLVANICQHSTPEVAIFQEATDSHQDIIPAILPMFHIYGFNVFNSLALTKGTKLVTLPKFTQKDYVQLLRTHKPSVLPLVPPIVLFLASNSMVKREDLQSVRITFCGAAPLGALDEQRFLEKAGKSVEILQGYGLTEASPGVTVLTSKVKSQVNSQGSIGRPVPNTLVKIIAPDDPTGTPLGPNTKGELLVKGPQVMKGYHKRPEETQNTFLDGWLRTGDIVYYNEDKVLFVTDRLKELIKVKGFQVAPAELEEIIRDFSNVEDVAVIGVPHPSQGELPRAYVVPKKGMKIDTNSLEEYVKNKVVYYKQLTGGVAVVDSIPKNASGKIMRRTLKMEYQEKKK